MCATLTRATLGKVSVGSFSANIRQLLFATGLAALCLATPRLFALDQAKLPTGANYAAAQTAPYDATGAGIPIGVIEPGPRPSSTNNLGARLQGQWGFGGKTPGQVPDDNSAAVLGACTTAANCPGRHMALVADTAAGAVAANPGVAPGASIYTAAISGFASSDPNAATTDNGFNSFRAAIDWMNRPQAAGPAYQQHPSIDLYNNSWGPVTENDDNGDNRFARFVDYFATSRDALLSAPQATTPTMLPSGSNGPGMRSMALRSARLIRAATAAIAHESCGASTSSTTTMERRPIFAVSPILSLRA